MADETNEYDELMDRLMERRARIRARARALEKEAETMPALQRAKLAQRGIVKSKTRTRSFPN